MGKSLENMNKEELLDFLEEYAANDAKFANAVNVRFGKPEFEKELNRLGKTIDDALDGASDYRRHGGWGYISVDTGDIFAEIEQRVQQGHIRLAFAEAVLMYRKLLEVFEYQEECEIADEAEDCIDFMSEIADKAVVSEDKEYIFNECIALSNLDEGKNCGADYEGKLLKIAAKFVTPENKAQLEKAINLFDVEWRREEFALIRLEIIGKLEGEKSAAAFIAENLRFPKIREIAFEKAVTCGNFEEAECLCVDALSVDERSFGISHWLYKLYSVHEMMENTEKMAETAEKILLRGDLKYYDVVKTLLERQAVWNKSYPELLRKCESKLFYSGYAEILAKENEYDLLLEQVKKHPELIYGYGKLLAEKYPADICSVFIGQIKKEAESANKRESYNLVCSHISCFAESGYTEEATDMTTRLKLEYKRKPAFVDELNKVK